jgi:IS5 family transposase
MLRIHLLQQFFGHSDPAMKEALHNIPLYREFAKLDNGITRLPDESTILRFRHMLEQNGLGAKILESVNAKLIDRGLLTGTVVDATLNPAPSFTKNDNGEPRQGGASVSGDQVSVRASQDALPGIGQEHQPTAGDVCTV